MTGPAFDTHAYLTKLSAEVERALDSALPKADTFPPVIHQAMRYTVMAGGKRLRAALAMEAAAAVGSDRAAALPVAAAVEMIHAYSLIHDDLPCMDDDDMRRGKPSNHKVYGEGIAVLAGDALLTHAFGVLANLPQSAQVPAERSLQIVHEVALACGTQGLIGGQTADLEAAGAGDDADLLDYIHRNKTGALIRASVRAGGLAGDASTAQLESLSAFALHFGLAFQIVDDILDVTGTSDRLGKEVGSDEKQAKLTYPKVHGLDASRSRAKSHVEKAKAALEDLGPGADVLRALADFALARDN